MAVLAAAYNAPQIDPSGLRDFRVGNDIVYAGGLVSMLTTAGTGLILAGQDTDNHKCIGVACETVDGTGGTEPRCAVWTEGSFWFNSVAVTTAMVGTIAYISDDNHVVNTGTSNTIFVGTIEEVDTTNALALVRLNPYSITA